ncbi:ABC transporter permease [Carboxylicivirga sp. N1Y90]|uniref:ABC transporter permease n=1 Tax=Carboxylicivirga fragile TaxID=3417571 RepID=UPI003D353A85|nr:ABC transporter permease [Marinilabiliaceae bacterium N1Y90]
MRILISLLQKEFLQIFRNKTLLPLIFVLPLVQLIVLVNAATMDMKNIRITVVDMNLSSTSRLLVSKLEASPFFEVGDMLINKQMGIDYLQDNKTDILLYMPQEMEQTLTKEGVVKVQIIADAIDASKAQLAFGYLTNIIQETHMQVMLEQQKLQNVKRISTNSSFWFNPDLNYKYYMLPGVLVILVTLIGLFLSALNLVREKEIGTAEQINVTPIKKYQFILGKLIPFLIIGLFELTLGLLAGKLIYGLPFSGSLLVLYSFASIYLIAVLGLGLLISTLSQTQQQVMMVSFFFMLIFILLSGAFTAVENMPELAQKLNVFNPVYYFMNAIRMILIKGAVFAELASEFRSISIYACISVTLAVLSYRKTN